MSDDTHGSPELDEDAAKLLAMGADPGPTLADVSPQHETTPTPRYRLLRTGEMIRPGDEHLNDDAETWSPVPRRFCIPFQPSVLQPVRRRL